MNLSMLDRQVREELHREWLLQPHTQDLLSYAKMQIAELDEQLDKFAAGNSQDLCRITNALNRRLTMKGIINYVRTGNSEQ